MSMSVIGCRSSIEAIDVAVVPGDWPIIRITSRWGPFAPNDFAIRLERTSSACTSSQRRCMNCSVSPDG